MVGVQALTGVISVTPSLLFDPRFT